MGDLQNISVENATVAGVQMQGSFQVDVNTAVKGSVDFARVKIGRLFIGDLDVFEVIWKGRGILLVALMVVAVTLCLACVHLSFAVREDFKRAFKRSDQ